MAERNGINPIGTGVILGGAGAAGTYFGVKKFINPLLKDNQLNDEFVKSVTKQIAEKEIAEGLKELKAVTETGEIEGLAKELQEAIKTKAGEGADFKKAAAELFDTKALEIAEGAKTKATGAITESLNGKVLKTFEEGSKVPAYFKEVEAGLKEFKTGAAKKYAGIVGGALAVLGLIIGAASRKSAKAE